MEVMNSRRLAYRIEAGSGDMNEDSRVINMVEPFVRIYGEDGGLSQKIQGLRGRVWPVDVKLPPAEGEREGKTVTKYDWRLQGGVIFESAEGYWLQSDEMSFTNEDRYLSSDAGVAYTLPTGRGSTLSGKARRFRAGLDAETGRLHSWSVIGDVELSSAPAPGREAAPAPPTAAPSSPDPKKSPPADASSEASAKAGKD